jgi:hypothetical protein
MRPKLAASDYCDPESFTRSLEKALRDMWIDWCNKHTTLTE